MLNDQEKKEATTNDVLQSEQHPPKQPSPPPPSSPPEDATGSIRYNRIFILDTNVLIHDERAIYAFKDVVVGIPFIVLEELDTFKSDTGERGRNARAAIRTLDNLRFQGSLSEGIPLSDTAGTSLLKVFPNPRACTVTGEDIVCDIKDNIIIQTVHDLTQQGKQVTLVSKDINARVKADALGLEAEDYAKGKVNYDQFYKGWFSIQVPAMELKTLTGKRLAPFVSDRELYANQFIICESENNPENYRLFRFMGGSTFREIHPSMIMNSFGPKNIQQTMALDLLLDDDVQLLTLLGPAGTGKTFLALLAGLFKVAHERVYRRLLVTRPVVALGSDIGYLPGDLQEKLHYWMQPIHDNLEFIYSQFSKDEDAFDNRERDKKKGDKKHKQHNGHRTFHQDQASRVQQLQQKGILSLEAITYMRGRSIPFQFLFIDEVQNLTPHEVKTIVSRAGEGTKVILAGDPYQIDSPYLDFTSNGLTVTTEKFKEHSIFGTVFLEISERSELAKLAIDVL